METNVAGTSGRNANGVAYGGTNKFTISGGTGGQIRFNVPKINDGLPITITGVKVMNSASEDSDTFNYYFVSSDKKRLTIDTGAHWANFGQATVDFFNSKLDSSHCWGKTIEMVEYCPDVSPSSGSCKITPANNYMVITWEPISITYEDDFSNVNIIRPYIYNENYTQGKKAFIYSNGWEPFICTTEKEGL